jgi:hypothetical protein
MDFWKHDAEDEVEPSSSGALDLAREDGFSFFPIQKEHLSAVRRSWEDGKCHDGDSYGWSRTTTISATRLRARRNNDRHFLWSALLLGFDKETTLPDRQSVLDRVMGLGTSLMQALL